MKKKINWGIFLLCILIVYSVAFIGSLFTMSNVNSEWYQNIKPVITPPNWVFPIVWNILFFLIGLSFYFALTSKKLNKKNKILIISVFSINFLFNILWSFIFFTLKSPLFAFLELVFLLLPSIALMIYATEKVSKLSSNLLIPYLFWVTFAGALNYLAI